MIIRDAGDNDLEALLEVEKAAFGRDDEAQLVKRLLVDESAKPYRSLVAVENNRILGHILFSNAFLANTLRHVAASILAPLAVLPKAQRQGIGGRLIKEGFKRLARDDIELVFVLGYPQYYTRYGFKPAGRLGFDPPYPIPEKNADAWMVHALRENVYGSVKGQIVCANVLDKEEYWKE